MQDNYPDNVDDTIRAGIATSFFLLGASIVLGVLAEAGPARLVLGVSAPVLAALAGVYVGRSARNGGRQ
jgi:hypothetical protein